MENVTKKIVIFPSISPIYTSSIMLTYLPVRHGFFFSKWHKNQVIFKAHKNGLHAVYLPLQMKKKTSEISSNIRNKKLFSRDESQYTAAALHCYKYRTYDDAFLISTLVITSEFAAEILRPPEPVHLGSVEEVHPIPNTVVEDLCKVKTAFCCRALTSAYVRARMCVFVPIKMHIIAQPSPDIPFLAIRMDFPPCGGSVIVTLLMGLEKGDTSTLGFPFSALLSSPSLPPHLYH